MQPMIANDDRKHRASSLLFWVCAFCFFLLRWGYLFGTEDISIGHCTCACARTYAHTHARKPAHTHTRMLGLQKDTTNTDGASICCTYTKADGAADCCADCTHTCMHAHMYTQADLAISKPLGELAPRDSVIGSCHRLLIINNDEYEHVHTLPNIWHTWM